MAVAVGDVVRISVEGLSDGQMIINTYHWRQSVAGTSTIEADVFGIIGRSFIEAYQQNILPLLHQEYTIVQSMTQRVFPTTSAVIFRAPNPAGILQGQGIGTSLPNMSAALMSWKTGLIGRARRGRNYYAPLPEAVTSFNRLVPGAITAFTNSNLLLAVQLVGIVEGSWDFGVYSSRPTSIPRWVIFNSLQSQMRELIATQRRRRVGHGR